LSAGVYVNTRDALAYHAETYYAETHHAQAYHAKTRRRDRQMAKHSSESFASHRTNPLNISSLRKGRRILSAASTRSNNQIADKLLGMMHPQGVS
jgi:hypothetical protein